MVFHGKEKEKKEARGKIRLPSMRLLRGISFMPVKVHSHAESDSLQWGG